MTPHVINLYYTR